MQCTRSPGGGPIIIRRGLGGRTFSTQALARRRDSQFVICLAGGQVAGAAMENHDYYVIIDALYWVFWIIPPLVVSLFLAWKAIEWLRDRREFDGTAVEESKDPWDQAISRPAADNNWGPASGGFGG